MIPGGIADKLGNRYEAKWLVRSLMDVISGKVHWINFESVETEYQGFEFSLARGAVIEWHQTKINSPGGNWTINALKKEGILKAFLTRLSSDKNAHCFFISQDNAKDFRTLTEKARTANSCAQYKEILSKEQEDSFQQLKEEWKQSDEVLFDLLNRSHVVIIPERELDSLIESYGGLYFLGGGEKVFPFLRDFLEKHFNKTVTGDFIRSAIKEQEILKLKEWSFDPTIQQRLSVETEAYLNTYNPFGAGGETIARAQTSSLVAEILNTDGPELILLTGVAGSGKSGVVRGVIKQLHGLGIPHLAFRVDQYLSCRTKEELGKSLTGREESPVSTLKGTFPITSSFLIIDQVDAVSEVSGRDGQIKEVIFRLITDAHNFGGVRTVVVCRTFDLDSDPRLKSLKEANRTKQIDVPLFDWNEDVEPLMKAKGFNVSSLNERQRHLLCLPVNLAIFLEINDPGFSFQSMSNLHEKLIEKKQRTISKERKPGWSLFQPLTAMCEWMSQRQKLNAPVSVLDAYPNAVDILTSEGLIISARGQVNFFHESFFDHIYARAFVINEKTLFDLLLETEQYLFRRTQVRQILEALRQNDFNRYLKELTNVLSSNLIRYHIKIAVCQWLNSIDKPSEEEFIIIDSFNEPDKKFHQLFRNAILTTPAWFELLNERNWILEQINGDNNDRIEAVLWWLSIIAGQRPVEIATLLRSWWGGKAERAGRLLNWFGVVRRVKPDDDLLQLCEDIIKSHPEDLFQDQGHDRIMMLFYTWGEKSPELCSEILHSLFEAWFVLYPERNPFGSEKVKVVDVHSLAELAAKAPQALLQGTTDALARLIDMVIAEGNTVSNWHDFNYRTYSGHRFGFDEFLDIYRTALKKVLQEFPDTAISYIKKLDPNKHHCLMHLYLEAIQANPPVLGYLLPMLATNNIIFNAGWHGADWLSFARACHEAFPYLDSEERMAIEQVIVKHKPELDLAIKVAQEIKRTGQTEPFWTRKGVILDLNNSGYEQWCILETIGDGLLSEFALSKLQELRRKFTEKKIAEPEDTELHLVGSPIGRAQCERMKDQHWLSAINNYDNKDGRGFMMGGARELAGELQEATKNAPIRFSDLCLKIPDSANPTYIEHILWGLADSQTPSHESLAQVIRCAYRHPSKQFGRDIARLLGRHPAAAGIPEILDILIWYALNGEDDKAQEADEKNIKNETITIETLIKKSGGIRIVTSSTRGRAWEALASVLWEIPEMKDRAWETIESALKEEKLIHVRCCMMKLFTPLFNMDKKRFADSIQKLIMLPDGNTYGDASLRLSPLITYEGIRLFPYIYHWLPDLADKLVNELLESGEEAKELIGAWLLFGESFRKNRHVEKTNELASLSVDHRRLLADVASNVITWAENRNRAETILGKCFFDKDEQVRKIAATVFSHIKADEVTYYKDLASVFLESPAFWDISFPVLHMLENATCDVLELVIKAIKQVIGEILRKGDERGSHLSDLHHLQDLIRQEYISSESRVDARKEILDVIDLMLCHEIYGVDSVVTTYDRL
jgi:hypothetical protein